MENARKEPITDFYDLGKELGKFALKYAFCLQAIYNDFRGAFAVVRLCTSKKDGKEYAVKIVEKNRSSASQRENLSMEVSLMAKTEHKNIVRLVDLFEDQECIYIVMELYSFGCSISFFPLLPSFVRRLLGWLNSNVSLTGGELFDRIVEVQSYSEKDAARIIRQILEALDHIHERKVCRFSLFPVAPAE
jgi:serine/threonine protein kinase